VTLKLLTDAVIQLRVRVQFMDEPTSGLDARSAATVMTAVRNVASNGRTVMVTIHQPSIEIFESFDRLVLLGPGGNPVFIGQLGTQSCNLIEYLQVRPRMHCLRCAVTCARQSSLGRRDFCDTVLPKSAASHSVLHIRLCVDM
jgi:energy-coupling factor transporter ATP-binding protein EcfA2